MESLATKLENVELLISKCISAVKMLESGTQSRLNSLERILSLQTPEMLQTKPIVEKEENSGNMERSPDRDLDLTFPSLLSKSLQELPLSHSCIKRTLHELPPMSESTREWEPWNNNSPLDVSIPIQP